MTWWNRPGWNQAGRQPITQPCSAWFVHAKHELYQSLRLAWYVQTIMYLMESRFNCIWKQIKNTLARVYSRLSKFRYITVDACDPLFGLLGRFKWVNARGWVASLLPGVLTVPWSPYVFKIVFTSPDIIPSCCACSNSIAIDLIIMKDRTGNECVRSRIRHFSHCGAQRTRPKALISTCSKNMS